MWRKLGQQILRYRFPLLVVVLLASAFMAWQASQVQLSYEFSKAIPSNHPANITYQEFRAKYGQDGNLLVVGIQTENLFEKGLFDEYSALLQRLKKSYGVTDVIAAPSAVNLKKDPFTEKLNAVPVFPDLIADQVMLDSLSRVFYSLPFYRGLLYNPSTGAWMMGVSVDKELMNTKKRNEVVKGIRDEVVNFENRSGQKVYLSGLPLIRTEMATRIADEMKWFLLGSVLLSALILLLFFRSFSAMLLSLGVVILGVIWTMGTMQLMGYKITLLTALIPPLIVVIGIPNCIYFLNKYHTAYNDCGNRHDALVTMVGRMGIVTLFCNLAAAIGFAVFALTKSEILQEFGVVAGINIMVLFLISLVVIPVVLSLLPPPRSRHVRYLQNPRLNRWLARLERWSLNHRKLIYGITAVCMVVAIAGIFRLKSVGFIVDDLPQTDKIYTDLKFFERNFEGVMPLEILVRTNNKAGIIRDLEGLKRIDSLSQSIGARPEMARPLSIVEGLKFAKQAYFEGDSANYSMPSQFDLPAMVQYLRFRGGQESDANSFTRLVSSFMDSARQEARISINMADVGSNQLPLLLDTIKQRADQLFDTSRYSVQMTGTSITFLEGSSFIINGLKESIFWAFLLITLCMLYLFKSTRILICSLIPNLIPLVITAGVMGWVGVPLKPSTVLVFSVALGIAIDITIRFLINYKQELPLHQFNKKRTVIETIYSTGISIIYTSLVLIAGFIIFSFSGFGGTQALGWLTSLTLVTATFTNLVLLPALLITMGGSKNGKELQAAQQID